MSENYADLGSVAVLDPDNLVQGQIVEINGELCHVDKIVEQRVFLSIVHGPRRWKYKAKKLWWEHKFPFIFTVSIGAVVILYFYFKG